MASNDVWIVPLDGLAHHLVPHMVLSVALLTTKFLPIHFSEPFELVIRGEPVSPWVVLVNHLGRFIIGREYSIWHRHLFMCLGVLSVR